MTGNIIKSIIASRIDGTNSQGARIKKNFKYLFILILLILF